MNSVIHQINRKWTVATSSILFSCVKTKPTPTCFPVNFANLLRTLFLQNTSRRLLLKIKVIPAKQIKRFQRELCHKPCSEFQENVFQFPDVCATLRYRGNLSPNNFDKTPSYINEKSVMCFFANCFDFLF